MDVEWKRCVPYSGDEFDSESETNKCQDGGKYKQFQLPLILKNKSNMYNCARYGMLQYSMSNEWKSSRNQQPKTILIQQQRFWIWETRTWSITADIVWCWSETFGVSMKNIDQIKLNLGTENPSVCFKARKLQFVVYMKQ
jgi:hypothetical protein